MLNKFTEKNLRGRATTVHCEEVPISLPKVGTLVITSKVASVTYQGRSEFNNERGQVFTGYGIEVRQKKLPAGEFYGPLHSTNLVIGQLRVGL